MTRHSRISALAIAALLLTTPAAAATITIELSGLDAVYDGFDLYDAGAPVGGNQLPAQSDPLTAASFFVNGNLVGTLSSQLFADFAFVDVRPIPVGGGTVVTPFGGFFDLLTSNTGFGMGLNFDSFAFTYNATTRSLTGSGAATLLGQSLPFGLVANTPIQLSLLFNTLTGVTQNTNALTSFTAVGNATISAVPEPSALMLIGVGVVLCGRRFVARHRG